MFLEQLHQSVTPFNPLERIGSGTSLPHIPNILLATDLSYFALILIAPPRSPLQRASKAYEIDIRGKQDWVSIDHLKPSYLDDDLPKPETFMVVVVVVGGGGVLWYHCISTLHKHHLTNASAPLGTSLHQPITYATYGIIQRQENSHTTLVQHDTCLALPFSCQLYYYCLY